MSHGLVDVASANILGRRALEFPAPTGFETRGVPCSIGEGAGPMPCLDPVDFLRDSLVDGKSVFRHFALGSQLPDPPSGFV